MKFEIETSLSIHIFIDLLYKVILKTKIFAFMLNFPTV